MNMKNLIALLMIFTISTSAFASELSTARSKGHVKELPSGYIEAVDASAKELVERVNKERKAYYQKIADETRGPVKTVASEAAKKIQIKLEKKKKKKK